MVKRINPLKIEKGREYKIKRGKKNIFPLIFSFFSLDPVALPASGSDLRATFGRNPYLYIGERE
jgi:hypothetical protein